MASYTVLKSIQHDGAWYEPGAAFEMDEKQASYLIEAGAIEAVEEPAKAA